MNCSFDCGSNTVKVWGTDGRRWLAHCPLHKRVPDRAKTCVGWKPAISARRCGEPMATLKVLARISAPRDMDACIWACQFFCVCATVTISVSISRTRLCVWARARVRVMSSVKICCKHGCYCLLKCTAFQARANSHARAACVMYARTCIWHRFVLWPVSASSLQDTGATYTCCLYFVTTVFTTVGFGGSVTPS